MTDHLIYSNNDDMNIDDDIEDEDQMGTSSSKKMKRNFKNKKDIRINDTNTTMNNNKFNLINQNSTFNSTLFFSNQTTKPNPITSTLTNNLTSMSNSTNDLTIPQTINNISNSLNFSTVIKKTTGNDNNNSTTTATSFLNNIKGIIIIYEC